jgi:D-3-phosphoglycerate dehydrogenase
MILFRNKNRPGVIGRIGTCLGEQKINIADFRLGKKESADEAMAIVNIDSAPVKEQVEQMKQLDDVIDVRTVSF